tara:strand:+ start:689 stop:1240 length:552 start_codon:yes stop_codon:yes gene_type:complete
MKRIYREWKKYLLKEELEKYVEGGMIELFRFSARDMDKIPLDPEKFRSARMSYSKNDYNVSSFPRVFFYLDPSHLETVVAGAKKNLYSVKVSASDIYDLVEDPEDLLHKSKKASGMVVPNLDKVLKSLAKEDKPGLYPEYFTPIRDEDAQRYKGVYYRINQGTKDIVIWFDKIEATRVEREEI